MKTWRCPECKRLREYDYSKNILLKVCYCCQVPMEEVEEDDRRK